MNRRVFFLTLRQLTEAVATMQAAQVASTSDMTKFVSAFKDGNDRTTIKVKSEPPRVTAASARAMYTELCDFKKSDD